MNFESLKVTYFIEKNGKKYKRTYYELNCNICGKCVKLRNPKQVQNKLNNDWEGHLCGCEVIHYCPKCKF